MTVSRASRQIFAVILCAVLLYPTVAPAAEIGLAANAGVIELPASALRLPASPALTMPATVNPASLDGVVDLKSQGRAVARAAVQAPAAVEAHPVISVINQLQAQGALPDGLSTAADAAKLEAGAQALPAGPMREHLISMAHAAAAAAQGSGAGLDKAYDKAATAADAAAPAAAGRWFWNLIPSGLRKAPAAPAPKLEDPETLEVPVDLLRWSPALGSLPESTRSIILKDKPIVGQDSALKAIYFGLKMSGQGYNLYVSGPEGSGRETAVRSVAAVVAKDLPTPMDKIAVTNLRNPGQPVILDVAPGQGRVIKTALQKFLMSYSMALPQVLSSPKTAARKREIVAAFEQEKKARHDAFDAEVAEVRFNGDFGLWLGMRQDEEGMHPLLKMLFVGADGRKTTIDSEEKLTQIKSQNPSVTIGWEELLEAAQKAAEPHLEKLGAITMQDMEEASEGNAKIAQIDAATAGELVEQMGGPLAAGLARPHNTNTPAHKAWEERVAQRQKELLAEIAKIRIGEYGLIPGRMGFSLAKVEGDTMTPLAPEEVQAKLASGELTEAAIEAASQEIGAKMQEMNALNRAEHDKLHADEGPLTEDEQKVGSYVTTLMKYAAEEFQSFLPSSSQDPMTLIQRARLSPADVFRVDVLSTNDEGDGAPVVVENNPTYERLFGTIDESVRQLMLPGQGMVGVRSLRPELKTGSFFRANGGFLVLNVMDALREPGVWPALMRAVRDGEAEISDSLVPMMRKADSAHVPAKVKIVLIGSPMIKMMLKEHDDTFRAEFNATAEFEPKLSISKESVEGYLQFFKKVVAQAGSELMDFTRDGMAALLQFAAREVSSNTKLTAQFGRVFRLMKEANFWAKEAGSKEVRGEHVMKALSEREERTEVYQRHMVESYQKGIMRVDVDGAEEGQINGLVVAGGTFGLPQRVLATYTPTDEPFHVVWADQAAKWTGSSADKSKADVEAFFYKQFGQKMPIKGKVIVSFTQLYGGLDGDSATSTMIYAILSAISKTPIQQRFAVTGSSNMKGEVQVIGGAIEKTEGFFSVASYIVNQAHAQGLNAVIIPWMNSGDLQLKPEVVQAVREGKFKIYRAREIGQGMGLLTGVPYQAIHDKVAEALTKPRPKPGQPVK